MVALMEQQQIIDAVSALIGQPFTPVRGQFGVRSKTATVEELIASYPSQMQSIRENIAKSFDELTPADIPKHIAATQMYLLQPFTKVGSSGAHGMTPEQAVEIGRIIERRNAIPQKGLVEMCYEDILQRDSDAGGFKHYQDRRDVGGEGNSTLDLVRDIYLSPEAVALRDQGSA